MRHALVVTWLAWSDLHSILRIVLLANSGHHVPLLANCASVFADRPLEWVARGKERGRSASQSCRLSLGLSNVASCPVVYGASVHLAVSEYVQLSKVFVSHAWHLTKRRLPLFSPVFGHLLSLFEITLFSPLSVCLPFHSISLHSIPLMQFVWYLFTFFFSSYWLHWTELNRTWYKIMLGYKHMLFFGCRNPNFFNPYTGWLAVHISVV